MIVGVGRERRGQEKHSDGEAAELAIEGNARGVHEVRGEG
jgi:hypothetical protein